MASEFDLLCALTAAELTSKQIDKIRNWNLNHCNWEEFLRLAERHGVIPLVSRNLVAHGHGIPAEVEKKLRSAYKSNLARSLWFTAELLRIMQRFDGEELRAVPFKGPALAQSLYGDVGLRSSSDLDFLISPVDFDRAKRLMAEIGYIPSGEIRPAVERLFLRVGYERSFDSGVGKNLVELQWAVQPYFYGVDLNVGDLLARAEPTMLGGHEIPSLASDDLLVVLCLHAAKHLWTRLIWLSDIAETLRTRNVDYPMLLSRARALGIVRVLGVSFWLVKKVLRGEIPKPAEQIIEDDYQAGLLGRHYYERIARGADYNLESTEYFRLILKLRERRADRLRYLWRLFWTPGTGDISAVSLPDGLFSLYHIVRMGRLMRKLI
jgi:putative nucleotidyltransferase-like protein